MAAPRAVNMACMNHANVLPLVGVLTATAPMRLVLQYCEHGSLDRYLRHLVASGASTTSMRGRCAGRRCHPGEPRQQGQVRQGEQSQGRTCRSGKSHKDPCRCKA